MSLLGIFHYITGIGDSLMSGEHVDNGNYIDSYDYSWLSYLCRRLNSKCKLYSHGGASAKSWLDTYGKQLVESRDNCPCYFICLGTNDFIQKYNIGSVNDKPEANTFSGYYKLIIDMIKNKNPYAYIFACSMYEPETDTNESGLTKGDYNKAIKNICNNYQLTYYLDFINQGECILGEPDITMNGHYNTIGYYKVSYAFEKAAEKIIEENINDFKKAGLFDSFALQYEYLKKNINI